MISIMQPAERCSYNYGGHWIHLRNVFCRRRVYFWPRDVSNGFEACSEMINDITLMWVNINKCLNENNK